MATYGRMPAVICTIRSLLDGTYTEMPGWEPNYVLVDGKIRASRVNIIGVVTAVGSDGRMPISLEDGSGQLTLRSFDDIRVDVSVGDLVLVVGRPRRYSEQVYVMPEIVRRIDARWARHRKAYLGVIEREREALETGEEPPAEQPSETVSENRSLSDTELIYAMIEEFDSGEGADVAELLAKASERGVKNAEKAIHMMLEMGDIFEIRAGKVKVL